MKIGTCVVFTDMDSMPKKLKALQDNGFDTCQLLCWEPKLWNDDNAETLKGLLAEYGVVPSAFWCGWEGPGVWDFYD